MAVVIQGGYNDDLFNAALGDREKNTVLQLLATFETASFVYFQDIKVSIRPVEYLWRIAFRGEREQMQ